MTPESKYLIALATELTEPYTKLPTFKAAMITGSAAKGLADRYSDIDMTMYYGSELPADDELNRIRHGLGGTDRRWVIGGRDEGSFATAYGLHGIEIQIGHTLISAVEETIKMVHSGEDVDTPSQKAMEGTLACIPLFGDEVIIGLQEKIEIFPDSLAQAMVEKNLRFFAAWGLEHHFQTRDATIWLHQILVECCQRLVAVWAGLNRTYFTTFQFKRQGRLIESMALKPQQAAERLDRLFSAELSPMLADLEALVAETIDLVEKHMPEVNTEQAKARIGWRHQPWKILSKAS